MSYLFDGAYLVGFGGVRWDSLGVNPPPPLWGVVVGGLGIRWDSEGFLAAGIRWESLGFSSISVGIRWGSTPRSPLWGGWWVKWVGYSLVF